MINIKRIDFTNYRIAGTGSLSFDDPGNGYHMHGIIASNGTGKTTILNAITWCLYGEEYQLQDSESALPIINSKKLFEMAPNESTDVVVRLTVGDNEKEIVFERKHKVIKTLTDDNVPCPVFDTQSELSVTVTNLQTTDSTQSVPADLLDYYVSEYFNKSIHEFFFFDGEKLEEHFSAKKASSIQTSVEAIAQISLLDEVIRNASEMLYKNTNAVAKGKPNVKKLEHDYQRAKEAWESDLLHIESLEKEKAELVAQKREIDAILQENSASTVLQARKRDLEEKLARLKREQTDLYKRKVKYAIRITTLVKLYPRIIAALGKIDQQGENGDYSVLLSKKQLEQILQEAMESSTTCPICGSGLGTRQMLHLQEIISRQTVDDDTSLVLRGLKSDLSAARDEVLLFRQTYSDFSKEEIRLQDEIADAEKDCNGVSEKLLKLGSVRDENGREVDFTKLEGKSRKLESDISSLDQSIGSSRALATMHERDCLSKKQAYEDAIKRENDDLELQKLIEALQLVVGNLSSVRNEITKEVRIKLEEITSKIFMRVMKKKDTFGEIRISDSYKISLYDKYGQVMTGSSSATEYMVLAYSYTLAIHEASGHNCPLVIDSPLGRVSGQIRENTADMLLEASKDKQIIMLFTEDEYSERVKNLFDKKASIKTIYLADHEKTWEGAQL